MLVTYWTVEGVGFSTRTVERSVSVPTLTRDEFAAMAEANRPTSHYDVGTAQGHPRRGLVMRTLDVEGEPVPRESLWQHIGHGSYEPVAVCEAVASDVCALN